MRIGENRAKESGEKFTAAATPGAAVEFTMDGQAVIGYEGETILEAARRYGAEIPHLCHKPGYRPAGNCRACMVEIDGERALAPSCCRQPKAGMKIAANSPRARHSQKMILELLAADMPADSRKRDSELDKWLAHFDIGRPRFARATSPPPICRIRQWRLIWTPAFNAADAFAPAAKSK